MAYDDGDNEKAKKQRQKLDNPDGEVVEAIKDSRYLLKLNNKFNRIYKVQSLQGLAFKDDG